jgi:hypothetical protein
LIARRLRIIGPPTAIENNTLKAWSDKTILCTCASVLLVRTATANDLQLFNEFLTKNEAGTYCVNLEHIAKNSATLDYRMAVGNALMYESDCGFDALLAANPTLFATDRAENGLTAALGREYALRRANPYVDHGVYGNIYGTMVRAIKVGLLGKPSQTADVAQTWLEDLAQNCALEAGIDAATSELVHHYRADPDRKMHVARHSFGATREFVQQNVQS